MILPCVCVPMLLSLRLSLDRTTERRLTRTSTPQDYKKMRVKQLRAILAERGAVCVGCYEKSDYVRRCKETEHLEL